MQSRRIQDVAGAELTREEAPLQGAALWLRGSPGAETDTTRDTERMPHSAVRPTASVGAGIENSRTGTGRPRPAPEQRPRSAPQLVKVRSHNPRTVAVTVPKTRLRSHRPVTRRYLPVTLIKTLCSIRPTPRQRAIATRTCSTDVYQPLPRFEFAVADREQLHIPNVREAMVGTQSERGQCEYMRSISVLLSVANRSPPPHVSGVEACEACTTSNVHTVPNP